jgi:hypothetical protein
MVAVHSNAKTAVNLAAAEISGVAEHGIDDERLARIIGSHLKANLLKFGRRVCSFGFEKDITTGEETFDSVNVLVDMRLE